MGLISAIIKAIPGYEEFICESRRRVLSAGVKIAASEICIIRKGATSEYPATHALFKSTAPVVRGP